MPRASEPRSSSQSAHRDGTEARRAPSQHRASFAEDAGGGGGAAARAVIRPPHGPSPPAGFAGGGGGVGAGTVPPPLPSLESFLAALGLGQGHVAELRKVRRRC